MVKSIKSKNVLVVGLGKSGVAAVRFCAERGALVTATDDKRPEELESVLDDLSSLGVELALGGNDPILAKDADLLVASPGVSLGIPLIASARERGVPIVGEMELAVREIERPIIAVTGTNGKTTTTALTGHLISGSGFDACVAGNIGEPILGAIERANGSDFVILETSSFQLDTSPSLSADIAIWLNATEDHIDRHGDFASYVASKAKLFSQMGDGGVGIYNARDEVVSNAVGGMGASLIPFDAGGSELSASERSGWYDAGSLFVKIGAEVHEYPVSGTRLVGAHNRENALAALIAAELAGCEYRDLKSSLSTFVGLPHRMEFVGECEGVSYFDDSKGTNVGATARALEGFAEPVVLIAGGLAKGADLSPLVPKVRDRVRRAILIGEAADEMGSLFEGVTETECAATMESAVRAAARAARPGDAVLLSPACASFDMFKDYNERGDAFKKAVRALKGKGL